MAHIFSGETLPIMIQDSEVVYDSNLLFIEKVSEFKTRALRKYYLNAVTVFPKVVYKTYWLDDHEGTLSKLGLRLKSTVIYPDIIGIEYAKTKTLRSQDYARAIECINGKGLIILQQPIRSLFEELIPKVINLTAGTKVVVPPHWSYTLVNTGNDPFVTLELLRKEQELNVSYSDQRGAPLYLIERNGSVEIVKNSQYKNVEKYVTLDSDEVSKALLYNKPGTLVGMFSDDCDCFVWFHKPIDHDWISTFDNASHDTVSFVI